MNIQVNRVIKNTQFKHPPFDLDKYRLTGVIHRHLKVREGRRTRDLGQLY